MNIELISIPKIEEPRGNLSVVEGDCIPFEIKRVYYLYEGLLIHEGIWRELNNFSSGSVCLVIASAVFDEDDYIRDFEEFLKFKKD